MYELRLRKDTGETETIRFTDQDCESSPGAHADRLSRGWDDFELLEFHETGPESSRDYGYGKGFEPILVGDAWA